VRHVVVVRRDAIHHQRMLAVLGRYFDAKLHVGALMLVREHLAHIVQQRAALGHRRVETELPGHDAGQVRHFLGMLQDVLPVARAIVHAPDELHELCVQSVCADFVRRLLAHFLDGRFDFLARLGHHFFDAARMDAPVGHQLLQRQSRDFASHRIEARHHHRVRRVVDDHVDARGELERTDVATLASDDPAFHFVVGQRYRRHADFGRVLGGNALHGERDDFLRLALGVSSRGLANLPDSVCRLGLCFLGETAHQFRFRITRGHTGQLLETSTLLGDEFVELAFPLRHDLLASPEIAAAAAELLLALIEDIVLAIETGFALLHSPLGALELFAALAGVDLPGLAQFDRLFLAGDDRRFSQGVGFASRFIGDTRCRFFGRRLGSY
jgi:hypothetical protein